MVQASKSGAKRLSLGKSLSKGFNRRLGKWMNGVDFVSLAKRIAQTPAGRPWLEFFEAPGAPTPALHPISSTSLPLVLEHLRGDRVLSMVPRSLIAPFVQWGLVARVAYELDGEFEGIGVLQGEELQVQRQVVRQLAHVDGQARTGIAVQQVDHRLATVAGLAVDVLEEQQRDRAAAFEQTVVAGLHVQQVALAEFAEQRGETVALRFGEVQGADQRVQRQAFLAQFAARVVQQQCTELQQWAMHGVHS